MPRATRRWSWLASSRQWDRRHAAATSCDAPCPTGSGSGSLASRSAVLIGTLQPASPSVEKETNADVVSKFASAGLRHLGPRWVRTAAGTAGPGQARTVTPSERESQVKRRPPLRPQSAKQPGAGFESHLICRGARPNGLRRTATRAGLRAGAPGAQERGDREGAKDNRHDHSRPVLVGSRPDRERGEDDGRENEDPSGDSIHAVSLKPPQATGLADCVQCDDPVVAGTIRWGHIGAHPGHERPDHSGQQRSPPARDQPSSAAKLRLTSQVAATLLGSRTQKRTEGAQLLPPSCQLVGDSHGELLD